MRRFTLLAVLGLALAAIAGLIFVVVDRDGAERGDDVRGLQPGVARVDATDAAPVAVDDRAAPEPAGAALDAPVVPAPAEEARVAAAEAQDLIPVLLELEGGRADARADVFLVTGSLARATWDRPRLQLRRRGHRGEHFATAADGSLWIPRPNKDAYLVAETPTHWGFTRFAPDAREVRVRLARYANIDVVVRDHEGSPAAGVHVELELGRTELGTEETDADGRARFVDVLAHLGDEEQQSLLRPKVPELDGPPPAPDSEVALSGPFIARIEQRFVLAEALDREFEFTLPACGALELRLVTPEGAPWAVERGTAELVTQIDGEPRADARYRRNVAGVVDARALFPWVELDQRFRVTIRGDGFAMDESVPIDGPTAPGERLVASIAPAGAMRLLHARLVEDGQPVVGARFNATLVNAEDRSRAARTRESIGPNAGGHLHVQIDKHWDTSQATLLELTSRREPYRIARIPLPINANAKAWTHDAGDVAVEPAPVLAAGRVVDTRDRPIKDARIWIAPLAGEVQAASRIALPRIESERTGAFVVLGGSLPYERLLVGASHRDFVGASTSVARGATDTVIVMTPVADLDVRLTFDDPLTAKHVQVYARALGGASWTAAQDRPELAPDASTRVHRAQRIAPDTYEVEVRLSNTGQVLLALGPILVPPEGHPVLTGDLRGRLHRHQLVVSSDAAQSSVAGFRWRASGTLHAWESVAGMWLHSAEVVATAPKVDVEASIAGFRTVRVSELSGREVAVAEPGLDVRFVLPGADALLADGHAKLLVNDLEVPWFKELDLELDAAGQATTRLGPGRYGARLRVGGRYTPQQDFAVLDTPDEQLVPLAQLAAHLAAWDDER